MGEENLCDTRLICMLCGLVIKCNSSKTNLTSKGNTCIKKQLKQTLFIKHNRAELRVIISMMTFNVLGDSSDALIHNKKVI